MSADEITKLFTYIQEFRRETERRFDSVEKRLDRHESILDAHSKQLDTLSTENTAIISILNRHDEQIEKLTEVVLSA